MKNLVIVLVFICSSCHPYLAKLSLKSKEARVDKKEAREAYHYLNNFRQNPERYLENLGLTDPSVKRMPKLIWNEKLAKVAELKAADMASRDYFSHQTPEGYGINKMIHWGGYKLDNWLRGEKRTNNFESIGAGGNLHTGKLMIDLLIIDEDVPSLGHRKHLLGVGEFNNSLKDIGIGYAYHPESSYRYYCVVIIAKHE